ncbi:hypothetical protein FX016_03450 [Cupriavidus gilardii]|nr:hypothetical protein FX016_03450 [Cupriavidus gilardii]
MFEPSDSAHAILDHLLAVLEIGATHFEVRDIPSGWGIHFAACDTASLHDCLTGVAGIGIPSDST